MKKTILPIITIALCTIAAYASERLILQIFQEGQVVQSYPIDEIDYIEINEETAAPAEIGATVSDGAVTVTWQPVEGATYSVYRSSDNMAFILIADNLHETTYTDTHPAAGSNYYRVKAIVDGRESDYSLSSPAATIPTGEMESGMYLGITSFNRSMNVHPIGRLDMDTKVDFDAFVDGLTTANGTLLYHSFNEAINALQAAKLPDDLFNVAIVTFTDGLDQGSMMLNPDYEDYASYLTALNRRIKEETVAGQPVTAYSIGVRGKDVQDAEQFQANLRMLASSDDNAAEVSSMTQVNAKFQEIARQLTETSYVQTINLVMPGIANGTRVRFTFDNVASADLSELYIEGTFNLRERSLTDISCSGLSMRIGESVQGEVVDGIFVKFTFDGVQTDSKQLISSEHTDEWTYIASTSNWQINSEFDKQQDSEVVTEKKSAVVMLVLDCSSSLGDDFSTAKSNARSFIATLCQTTGDDPEHPTDPTTLYSTTPTDLTLAVTWDTTRYFLTADQYKKANLTGATVEGLAVVTGDEQFIVALEDAPCDEITGAAAAFLYEDKLPSYNQGQIINARWDYVNNAITTFGGNTMSLSWTSFCYTSGSYKYYYYISSNGGLMQYGPTESTARKVRFVKPLLSPSPIEWKSPKDLTLAVKKDEELSYLTQEKYAGIDLSEYTILGLCIEGPSGPFFILSPDYEPSNDMTGSTALKLYGESLPSYEEGRVINCRWGAISNALASFGLEPLTSVFWTSEEYRSGSYSYYYYTSWSNGIMHYSTTSTTTYRVRTIVRDF
ncbi:MAG: hypothetical protein K1V84_02820 [Muribaculaceae bacterium]